MAVTRSYPVRVEARLDEPVSRWLWLVKWILAIPHLIVLSFLWIAYSIVTIGAFFAILVTGRYPRPMFEFTVGVLRWTWRLYYYTYAALGTDRYPPFTLAEVPDYPAHLDIDYPATLSRGLVLVKWWLLAVPHYVIAGVFVGGGTWFAWGADRSDFTWAAGGLVGVLVLVAGIIVLFTGRYPKPIFDFVLGMDRWVLRVAAYASLMTDDYPPFRLDMGGSDPSAAKQPESAQSDPTRWTGGRTAAAVVGAVLVLASMGLITGGGALLWADRTQRDADGFFSGSTSFSASSSALTSDPIQLPSIGTGQPDLSAVIGEARIRVAAQDPLKPLFVGIGSSTAVTQYLSGTEYTVVRDLSDGRTGNVVHRGGAVTAMPTAVDFWVAQASGTGTQTVTWPVLNGQWTVVVMNADGSAGIAAQVEAGATVPALGWVATGFLCGGALVLVGGVVLIWLAVRRPSRGSGNPLATTNEPVKISHG